LKHCGCNSAATNSREIAAGVPGNIDMAKGVIVGWGNMPVFNGYAMRDESANAWARK